MSKTWHRADRARKLHCLIIYSKFIYGTIRGALYSPRAVSYPCLCTKERDRRKPRRNPPEPGSLQLLLPSPCTATPAPRCTETRWPIVDHGSPSPVALARRVRGGGARPYRRARCARECAELQGNTELQVDDIHEMEQGDRWGSTAEGSVPQVVSVSHTNEWSLFQSQQKLSNYVKNFMQERLLPPLFNQFEVHKKDSQVEGWDYITKASRTNTLHLNVRLNGEKGVTQISFMGLLDPTPDWFFGISGLDMCRDTKFIDKWPIGKDVADTWATSYDAGLDNRRNVSVNRVPADDVVKVDNRPNLSGGYARYKLEKGSYAGYFPFWKILVIVGSLAIVVLVTFICLYPRCCKKQMLDVPVPLQDESQWAT